MVKGSIDARLERLGVELPLGSEPAAHYANYVAVNGLLFVSGKGPSGQPKGKLGTDYTVEEGYHFARLTAIEVLAVVKQTLGSLDHVKRVVKVQGFVNADSAFEEHHKVLNGFSDFMHEVFEENGVHARSVMGACSLRDNLPIIVDCIFVFGENGNIL
ncbi:enamine deaminase RidA (YjgF/YER057c/UK114 family) [Paenibacillus castaneae]|uniref:RidA family protein n=1 Tax=Paenibacillus castaneae TaxID=474957 RepID=UPI000C9AD5C8|nr:RidA family protein [Paenibacillus castaneae]NIK77827.1 enamine deaminase RidA (YjgF/YER057c/UK114 family) [Paenibacillus castaneae]